MCRKVLSIFFVLCLVINCTASNGWSGLKRRQHDAMHWIVLYAPDTKAGCTANAIGPHALLTAQHCDLPGAAISIDGDTPQPIVMKEYDGMDHMILIIPSVTFTVKIDYNPRTPRSGEAVYFWGNPRAVKDQYREGIYAGQMDLTDDEDAVVKAPVDMFVMPTQGGDSGSAIFNSDGDLVGVVTYSVFNGMFAGSYQLNFSKEQIKTAKAA